MGHKDVTDDSGLGLSDNLLGRILSRADGANVHAVRGAVQAYMGALACAKRHPEDPQWAEMETRHRTSLLEFLKTGDTRVFSERIGT